nr:SAM-dependent methyltransferase [Wenzhouxiangella sp. XN79A]
MVVVGSGIQLGRDLTRRAESELRAADRVFVLADAFAVDWVESVRPDSTRLSRHYRAGRDRRETYRAMEAELVDAVRAGQAVCAVFYGHPGVFADVPHGAIAAVRALGLPARMEPGISAEACLYADLGLDPGRSGVQSWEATQFLIERRCPDPTALLILWQVALTGDLALDRFHAEPEPLALLVEKLRRWYPADTEVVLYEAAQLPIERARVERLRLDALPRATYREHSTLVVPPIRPASEDGEWLERLRRLDASGRVQGGRRTTG